MRRSLLLWLVVTLQLCAAWLPSPRPRGPRARLHGPRPWATSPLAAKKKAKRERQRARKAEEVAARGVELELSERERAEGEKAATAFEELLAEMKM